MYVAESEGKKVLVVDNIETNEGTNFEQIADVYRTALVKFIQDQNLAIDNIQVGVGYTPPAIVASMPPARIKPQTPLAGTYTDAFEQRILWQRD
ncbi:MAG: hypothetical protein M3Q36_04530 [bacterium]|nr:hypothetical protein [bacterium]